MNLLLTRECKWLSYGGEVGWFALPQLAECPEAPDPAETVKISCHHFERFQQSAVRPTLK